MFLLTNTTNGSNFIDGLNGLLLIYMTTVIYVLLDTSLLLDTNVKLLFEMMENIFFFYYYFNCNYNLNL